MGSSWPCAFVHVGNPACYWFGGIDVVDFGDILLNVLIRLLLT